MHFKIFLPAALIVQYFLICESGRILGFFPARSKSSLILGSALLRGLAKHGHEVTMVSPFPLNIPVPNYTDVVMSDMKNAFYGNTTMNLFEVPRLFAPLTYLPMMYLSLGLTEAALQDKAVERLLISGEKFDAIIIWASFNEAHFALGPHFGAPVIALSTIGTTPMTNDLVGNPSHPAFVPEFLCAYTDSMSFWERFWNTISALTMLAVKELYYNRRQEALKEKYFPGFPDLYTITTNTSLVLLNSHFSIEYPKPLVPGMVEIGGFHVAAPKNLSADLQAYLDESAAGVIYFSMGSNLPSEHFPTEKKNAFLKAFGMLKQRVVWKWDEDHIPGQPENVLLGKWLPQQDILAHPNVKLFISHGGLLSTTEAVVRGVPMIGIPIVGDQHPNIIRAQAMGFALKLDFNNITTESLLWALYEMLDNPIYRNAARRRSLILRDQPISPLEKAIFWVEYVMRHHGAVHLRSAALKLKAVEYLLLDLIGAVFIFCLTVVLVIKFIWRCKRRNKSE